jgi:2-methylisocitrate lyase-like PEP mutase family enzyme
MRDRLGADYAARQEAREMSPTQSDEGEAFRALHREGCFVVPNPWDAGSARPLTGMGFAPLATSSGAAATRRAARAGRVGGSIEDAGGVHDRRIYGFTQAVERLAAAAEAARALPFPFTLTARCQNFQRGHTDLGDTLRRLQACAQAGARRIGLATSLCRAAMEGLRQAAGEVRRDGRFGLLGLRP